MDIETKITDVVVYPDRARVTRRGQVSLEPGLHRLEVRQLSIRLSPDSARVSAFGTARARLLGMQIQQAFYAETPAEQVRTLEEQVEAAQDALAALDGQLALNEQRRAHLDSLAGHTKVYARSLANGRLNAEDQLALFERLSRQTAELNEAALALGQARRQAERRREQLQQQLEQARSQRPRNRFTAAIDIDVTSAGELTIELSYLVAGASWTPLYDLRLEEQTGGAAEKPALEVGYLAQVTQNSGEVWQDVGLTLSTARPALASAIPELKPWFVQPVPPPRPQPVAAPSPKMQTLRMAAPAAEMAMDDGAAPGEGAAPVEEAVAQVETSGTAVSYAIAGRATIPPDGSAFKAVIARYPLAPELSYVSAPAIVPAAYRRVKVRNDSAFTLLPGRASLFAGDEFMGNTRLELTAPQGEIEVYLGVDDRLRVERKLARREVDKTIIGGRRRLHYGYEIKLENLLPNPVSLLLRDQYPVGRHEEIKARLENADPRPARMNELNQVEWELALAPKEKRLVRFDFLVEYPQSMELIGLP